MIKVAIVEDDVSAASRIKEYLQRYTSEYGTPFRTDEYRTGDEFVFQFRADYDIVLMDIELPGMDGMTAAEQIRKTDPDVILIFITSMAQYAVRGYRVNARAYILKPVNYYSFSMELQAAIQVLGRKTECTLILQVEDGVQKIHSGDIYYIESHKHALCYHTKQGDFRVRDSMKNAEEKLRGYFFERCHVGYLVNLAYVSSISKDTAQIGQDRIPVSRQKRPSFIGALTNYIGGETNA